ncbi:MAG: hypothetical protein K2L45_00580 [Muribaculaceae bacterium]|nr:hypothetical protein [Muribaculaceae bacterium]
MHHASCIDKVLTDSLSFLKNGSIFLSLIALLSAFSACNQVDDDRIPSLPVYVGLSDIGLWNAYGVSGVGVSRNFINWQGTVSPAGFPYNANTYVGFGGVLLIGGVDPFTADPNVPLAYDLACPVECSPTVRVGIDRDNLEAVCPECGSRYDVVTAGGAPVAGPALTGKYKYGLRRYVCSPAQGGGYIIHN